MIFHDSTQKNFFSKRKNKAEFKCLDDFEVLSSDFPGLKPSAASMTSMTSTAKAIFLLHTYSSNGHFVMLNMSLSQFVQKL